MSHVQGDMRGKRIKNICETVSKVFLTAKFAKKSQGRQNCNFDCQSLTPFAVKKLLTFGTASLHLCKTHFREPSTRFMSWKDTHFLFIWMP
jgi:hypothetical protein